MTAAPRSPLVAHGEAVALPFRASAAKELVLGLLAEVLGFALGLVGLALHLEAAVARGAPGRLLHLALDAPQVVLRPVRRGHRVSLVGCPRPTCGAAPISVARAERRGTASAACPRTTPRRRRGS